MAKKNWKTGKVYSKNKEDLSKPVETDVRKDSSFPQKLNQEDTKVGNLVRTNFRKLKLVADLSIKTDVNGAISKLATPYAVTNDNNPILTGNYGDTPNEFGSVIPQLPRANSSTLLHICDSIIMSLRLNYNYLKLTENSNAKLAVNTELDNVWANIQAKLESSAYYQLGFFQMNATGKTVFNDTKLDILMFYQTFNQLMALIPLAYRKLLSFEQHIKDSCYYEGSATIESYFGALKKKAFQSQVYSISQSLSKNFIDMDWLQQVMTIFLSPSRRTNSMMDPILEATVDYDFNEDLEISVGTVEVMKVKDYSEVIQAAKEIVQHLTIHNIMLQARSETPMTAAAYANYVIERINKIIPRFSKFMKEMGDVLTVFERMHSEGLTTWKIGQYIKVDRIPGDLQPVYNIMLEDIYKSIFTGSERIEYNPKTQDWVFYDVWDVYTGIQRYSSKEGGGFLTFSTKTIDDTGAPDNMLYPVMFEHRGTNLLNRQGMTCNLETLNETPDNTELNRLQPLGESISIHVPSLSNMGLSMSKKAISWFERTVLNVLGYYEYKSSYAVDCNKICLLDAHQADITTTMENHIRLTSPFVMTYDPSGDSYVGFHIEKAKRISQSK